MTSVRFASASPHTFLSLMVYSPASSSTTFLIVSVADCSSIVFTVFGDFVTTV